MTRDPFVAQSSGGLARIPLLPAEGAHDPSPHAVNPLLGEGMLVASRQVGAAALGTRPLDDRLMATLRGYEVRARWRPTPHGAFAGVAVVRFSRGAPGLHLGDGHRARSNPSAAWLAAVSTQLLDDPDVLSRLTLTTSARPQLACNPPPRRRPVRQMPHHDPHRTARRRPHRRRYPHRHDTAADPESPTR